ncbi:hypothetical protein ASG92_22230 [Arthrobacter sp. Soil736]|uniref:phage tail protein n=1 Tax=Arthrobacter sp. Soil736 TaxID=1736395 RepID=UPI000700168B|nr:phage tail protein [Arthrobacter sp. Soil736]KRE60004.1 hypothetical protein ASG92_22230 [Arthrobacter sp. Soil736]
MMRTRPVKVLADADQWARCAHQGTALLPGGGVGLAWTDLRAAPPVGDGSSAGSTAVGLAFDRWGRLYRTDTTSNRVSVGKVGPGAAGTGTVRPSFLDIEYTGPTAVVIDEDQVLYVLDPGASRVHLIDLVSGTALHSVSPGPGTPADATLGNEGVLVLLHGPDRLVVLDAGCGPARHQELVPCCAREARPVRVAGEYILWRRPDGRGYIARHDRPAGGGGELEVDGATDIVAWTDNSGRHGLLVARGPGRPFLRFLERDGGWLELEPLTAPGFDGGAIAVSPSGRIAYSSAAATRWTAGSAARFVREGRVLSYRLDSGAYGTRWGRLFLDAVIPAQTGVALRFLTTDDDELAGPLDAAPASNTVRGVSADAVVPRPDLTPPFPPRDLLYAAAPAFPLHRRRNGSEQPWHQRSADDPTETFEQPVTAPAGRYLWIEATLTGTGRVAPAIESIRVEVPGHDLLAALPRQFSRNPAQADFLQRLLAPAEGLLHELDERAANRHVLVDPAAVPQEALAWLASFTGLALDRRWPEAARRQLIAETFKLYRYRGTLAVVARILELYLGNRPSIVENWQTRGLGGTVLGLDPAGPESPGVGALGRSTGALGRFSVGGRRGGQSSFAAAAHRFTVIVPGTLSTEQRAVAALILDSQRPAHTLYTLCETHEGMRVGGFRVGLTSYPAQHPVLGPATVSHIRLGDDAVIGYGSITVPAPDAPSAADAAAGGGG